MAVQMLRSHNLDLGSSWLLPCADAGCFGLEVLGTLEVLMGLSRMDQFFFGLAVGVQGLENKHTLLWTDKSFPQLLAGMGKEQLCGLVNKAVPQLQVIFHRHLLKNLYQSGISPCKDTVSLKIEPVFGIFSAVFPPARKRQ